MRIPLIVWKLSLDVPTTIIAKADDEGLKKVR